MQGVQQPLSCRPVMPRYLKDVQSDRWGNKQVQVMVTLEISQHLSLSLLPVIRVVENMLERLGRRSRDLERSCLEIW